MLLVCGFLGGFAIPPTSSVLRSQWTNLLEPHLHQAAYALDSTMIELIFISGPLLTAIIATIASPAAALIVSAFAVITGTAIFTSLEPTRHFALPEHPPERSWLGALTSPGVRTLVFVSVPDRRLAGDARGRHPRVQPRRGRRRGRRRAAGDLVVRERGRRAALRDAPAPRAASTRRT